MRSNIHPKYVECTVKCSCGNTFTTHSTKPELRVELCNQCHPFFTGQQKFVDTGGRVQRFSNKFGSAAETAKEREAAKVAARKATLETAEAERRAAREAKAAEKAARAASYTKKAEKPAPEPVVASETVVAPTESTEVAE